MYPSDRALVSIFRVSIFNSVFGFIRGEEKPAPDFSSCSIRFQIDSEPSFARTNNNLSGFVLEITI